jgi:hypothetical protein
MKTIGIRDVLNCEEDEEEEEEKSGEEVALACARAQ